MPPRAASSDDTDTAFTLALAQAGSAAILPWFRTSVSIENKDAGGFDPVTEADRAAEQAMRTMIEETYPDDGIDGEEFGIKPSRSGRRWILDPVDGTRSFICGIPTWMTLIALVDGETVVTGAAHQAFVGETFVGSRKGAFSCRGGARTVLTAKAAPTLALARGGTTNPRLYRQPEKQRVYDALGATLRNLRHDADAYFFCMVAAGQMDLAIDTGLKSYDIAALIPIIEGAGGCVTTWTGGSALDGGDILATASPGLHEEALALIAAQTGDGASSGSTKPSKAAQN